MWQAAQAGRLAILSSELAITETLVGPLRSGDAMLVAAYDRLFRSVGVRLLPVAESILREAARLRAVVARLRTPDAIHAATAIAHGCAQFLTKDHGFRNVPGLPVVILGDLVTP